jgi:hypothetical protein
MHAPRPTDNERMCFDQRSRTLKNCPRRIAAFAYSTMTLAIH